MADDDRGEKRGLPLNAGVAFDALGTLGRALTRPLPKIFYTPTPGRSPGHTPGQSRDSAPSDEPVVVSCIDYGPGRAETVEVDDLTEFLAEARPDWATVRWINVSSVADEAVVEQVADWFGLHPLAVEDIVHVPQRPKVEPYPDKSADRARLFVVVQMNRLVGGRVTFEQVSICVGADTVVTFQERVGDVWDPIRDRVQQEGTRIRNRKTGYLTYALLDAIIDHNFAILEHSGTELESLEALVLKGSSGQTIARIHGLKRELMLLRRNVWPMREVVNTLQRDEQGFVSEETRLFLRDAYDHTVQVLDVLETYREVVGGVADTHMTVVGNRMNDVMKTLTMVATVFIPISFLAGVFGMNFDDVPGLHSQGAFVMFCLSCLAVAGGMLFWFRTKAWW